MHSYLATPSATLEVLGRWGLHTKKALGQHFLVDDNVIARIGELAEVGSGDTVLEVGPGIGTLTVALLAEGAQVLAVERDSQLVPVLMETCREVTSPDEARLALIEMDATDLQAGHLECASSSLSRPELPAKMVANLPYAVAATIVLECLRSIGSLRSFTVMVQHEVAARMCARPGTKDYGAYSVKMALLAQAVDSFHVPPGCFLPPPRVESRVIRIDRREGAASPEVLESACFAADAAFAQRRKTIRNSMRAHFAAAGLPADLADEVMAAAGVDPRSRGESHPPEVFLAMGEALCRA